jgi:dTDP-glucose 4,6-dehydratase
MKLFVTGGAGFIGSNFIRQALSSGEGYRIVNFDALTYAGNLVNLAEVASDADYQFIRGDIRDAGAAQRAMEGCDAVVHFAAETHVDRSIYEPAPIVSTNVGGTLVLLQAARELKVSRFLHVSTDEVYGDVPAAQSAHEDFPLQPNSPYSASKAGADLLVRSFVRTYGFPAIVTRCSNNYGPYQFPEKFLSLMICNALEDRPLPLYGDGMQERDWIHVEDHCRALMLVLRRGRDGETYNIGGGHAEKNLVIAKRVLAALDRPASLIEHVADRPGHDRRYSLDCGKIRRDLGWIPAISLEDGIAQTIAWYERNRAWIQQVQDGEYRRYYETYYTHRDVALQAVKASR